MDSKYVKVEFTKDRTHFKQGDEKKGLMSKNGYVIVFGLDNPILLGFKNTLEKEGVLIWEL